MTRSCLGVLLAAAISIVAAAPATAAPIAVVQARPTVIDPGLHLEAVRSDRTVQALVVLRTQAELGSVRSGTRKQRLAEVERRLRTTATGQQRGLLSLLKARRASGHVAAVTPLWIANEIEVDATPAVIRELASRPEVSQIRANLTVSAPAPTPPSAAASSGPTESNVARVNAPALWDLGIRGQGVVVANLDTGVDVNHPDLASRWRGGGNSWFDPNGQHPTSPVDVNGHGTWTMGVMVGGNAGGTSIGVAPGATWIAAKIFNDRGVATATGIHRAFQWVLDPDGNPATADAPNVVNNSWSMSGSAGCTLEFQPDLRGLRAAGILPVFAAGNDGPTAGTVFSPANLPEALSVAALDAQDAVLASSSRGPSPCPGAGSPSLSAPGDGIRTSDVYGSYTVQGGTSMAAPHVAGALALLLSAFPGIDADRQAAAVQGAAVDLGTAGVDPDTGNGRIDALAAYRWLQGAPDFRLSVSPTSVTVPAGGNAVYSVTGSAINGLTSDVALSLSGLSANQATWTFAPGVISAGTGSAQLTVTPAAGLAPGTYPLTVSGTGAGITHRVFATLVIPAPPDFTLSVSPASATATAGATARFTMTVAALNGFAGSVSMSVSGLPASVGTSSFSPSSVAGAGSSQLSILTSPGAAAGSYPLTVTGTSGTGTHSAAITLVVTAAGDFSVAASPATTTVTRGHSASMTVTVSTTGGFTGSVSLARSGLPAGTSTTWSGNPVSAPGAATLTIKTTASTQRGTFVVTITGTSRMIRHSSTATLIVR